MYNFLSLFTYLHKPFHAESLENEMLPELFQLMMQKADTICTAEEEAEDQEISKKPKKPKSKTPTVKLLSMWGSLGGGDQLFIESLLSMQFTNSYSHSSQKEQGEEGQKESCDHG